MKTALFIMLPVPSHYNACFGLADYLHTQGYRVIFSGTHDLKVHVESQGFEFTTLHCLEEYIINNWRTAVGFFLKSAINKSFMRFRYREFLEAAHAVREMFLHFNPDEIFIDQHLNHYYFLLNRNSRITLVNTKLPTRREKGIPPLTCSIPFKNNFFYSLLAKVLWKISMVKSSAFSLLKKVIFLGIDDDFFLKRLTSRQGIDMESYRRKDNALYESIRNVPIIHVRPRFLEYDWYSTDDNERFIYFPYENRKVASKDLTDIWRVIRTKHENIYAEKANLIYASLGTLSGLHKLVAIAFFQRLISVIEKIPHTYLIISAGELYRDIADRQSEKVMIRPHLPQTALLAECDMMITHAGMNSICECLIAGVPMLAYPLNMKSDQPGNAARVVAMGWGIKGDLRRDTERILRKHIMELLNNLTYRYKVGQVNMNPTNDGYLESDLAKSL